MSVDSTQPAYDCAKLQFDAVVRAIQQMCVNLAEPLRLADHAQAGLYSPYHFHRMFHEVTATTPARFLAAERMAEAKLQLAHTAQSVTTISAAVGYQSLGTFTTQFTALVGVSPGRFRALVDRAAGVNLADVLGARGSVSASLVSVQVTHDDSDLDPRLCTVGLFRADLPQGQPLGFGIGLGDSPAPLEVVPHPGIYQVFAASVPLSARVVDLALGTREGVEVGHGTVYVSSVPDQNHISLELHQPRRVDPPVVSSAAALHLLARQGRSRE